MDKHGPILVLGGVSKSFAAIQALDAVTLTLWPGEVDALVGENGAGKSTLVRIIAGVHGPDAGEIRFDGHPVHCARRPMRRRKGWPLSIRNPPYSLICRSPRT